MYRATVYSSSVIPTWIRWKSYKNICAGNFCVEVPVVFYILLISTTSFPLKISWKSGEAPDDWKKANVAKTFEKAYEKGVEVSLTSGPGQIVVQDLLAHSSGQIKEVTGTAKMDLPRGNHD